MLKTQRFYAHLPLRVMTVNGRTFVPPLTTKANQSELLNLEQTLVECC